MPGIGTTHDIRIGSNYYLVRPGTYSKRAAPMFGARFTSGDPDYNNLSFWQHWAQTCWIGGFGAPTWRDEEMFHEGVGIDASQHEVMTLSRDLGPANRTTGNWDLDLNVLDRIFTVFNDKLYCLQRNSASLSKLFGFTYATSTWALIRTFSAQTQWMEEFGGYLIFGTGGTTFDRMTTAEVFSTFAKPSGITANADTLRTYRGKLYVGFGRAIWRLLPTFLWDGSTAFYTAEDVNYLFLSEVHLGFLYFASFNGHILRTDGNNTFDLWSFDPFVHLNSMRSFDGRLFIAAYEELDGTTSAQSVLYQFSGAAVTELKRWGRVGYNLNCGRLRVLGHSLWFGAGMVLGMGTVGGFGIGRYDPIEDSYHLFAANEDTGTYALGTEGANVVVSDIAFYKGFIYCSVVGYGIFRTPYSYQDVSRYLALYDTTPAGGSVASLNGGWFTSSDFDAGTPGLMKLWNAITVHVDLPVAATSIFLEYSLNGGETWVAAGSLTGAAAGGPRYGQVFTLGTTTPVIGTRLKYRITLRTTDTSRSPQLRGVIVRYLPIPEPNWTWNFVVVLSDKQQLLDGTTDTIADVDAKRVALEAAFRAGTLVEFQDVDGTVWAASGSPGVLIADMVENIRPLTSTSLGDHELEVQLVLHEALEAY